MARSAQNLCLHHRQRCCRDTRRRADLDHNIGLARSQTNVQKCQIASVDGKQPFIPHPRQPLVQRRRDKMVGRPQTRIRL